MDLDAPPTVPDSPAGVLRTATEVVRRRRLVKVEDLEVLATWAALHSGDPTQGPGGAAARRRGDVLVLLGGEGTPAVQDFCLGEVALARGTGVTATTNALADVLDLRHRLPRVWARCRAGEAEVFVARRVAKLSRHLPLAAVAHVDAAVAQVVATESGGRTLAVAEGAIVAADPALHDERVDEQRKRRYVGLGRVDEFGLRTIIARTEAADAVWLDDLLDRVAQVIAPQHPDATPQEIRAVALGLVARPAEVLALLGESTSGETERARQAPRVVLHVHLHEAALAAGATTPGSVARVEGLGPATLARVRELLVGARVTVQPVLDLSDRVRTTAYEHPGSLKQRVHLVTGGDYWPYATSTSRGVDHDHPTPYDPHGPPGQTGTHNSGPLGRRHHRWKTHAGYRARQAGEGRYVWLTPHGLGFVVDSSGTRRVSAEHARAILDAPPGVDVYPMFR